MLGRRMKQADQGISFKCVSVVETWLLHLVLDLIRKSIMSRDLTYQGLKAYRRKWEEKAQGLHLVSHPTI